MDYIVLSIPIFFILITIEVVVSLAKGAKLYRFEDAITNISCGIIQQVVKVFAKTVLIVGYLYLYENHRFFTIPDNVYSYIILFISVDFFYYWFHRYAHEINLFWSVHIVHHQSEDYNLTVALRQSSTQMFVGMLFYLPLAMIGFNPIAFVAVDAFQTLYQFWIHTKTIKKLHPAFEFIFATPSHHRVHHGRNPKYIDKNHGGTLIIFDRMFGTFQEEEEEVTYGVTAPLASWNPFWANFDGFAGIWEDWKRPISFIDKIKLLYKKPGWLPESQGGFRRPQAVPNDFQRYNTPVSMNLGIYIFIQYLALLGILSYFLFNVSKFILVEQLMIAAFVVVSAVIFGGLMENKKWSKGSEILRVVAALVMYVYIF